ncbi:MAG: hypothetical protein LBS93_04370, partial [Synergistaceae bacterium]|nr:hypothetical protein [Synergistaceae bacterium]
IPDGENDGWLADPVWLNWWTDGYVPGGNSYGNSIGGAGSRGGGGCGVRPAALAAICMAAAVFLALPSVIAIRRRGRHVK